jgi:hypothetical protein
MLSSWIWGRVAPVRRTGVSEAPIASIFSVKRLWIFPARSEDMNHDARRRGPLATLTPLSYLSVTVDLFLKGRCSNECLDEPLHRETASEKKDGCLRSYIFMLHSRLRLGLPSGLLPSGFPTKNLYTLLLNSCHMSRPPHPARLDNSNYSWWRAQITQLFVMQFSLPSRHFTFLGPNVDLCTLFSNTLRKHRSIRNLNFV